MDLKELSKKMFLYMFVGFGLAYASELFPIIRNNIEYAMLIYLTLLSFLIEKDQHAEDGTYRYLISDVAVDVLAALGTKKILILLSGTTEWIPNNMYFQYVLMLGVSALVSTVYNSMPSDSEGA